MDTVFILHLLPEQAVAVAEEIYRSPAPELHPGLGLSFGVQLDQLEPVD